MCLTLPQVKESKSEQPGGPDILGLVCPIARDSPSYSPESPTFWENPSLTQTRTFDHPKVEYTASLLS